MRLKSFAAALLLLAAHAGPGLAQNSTADTPVPGTSPPKVEPVAPPPPPAVAPQPADNSSQTQIVVREAPAPAPAPMTIDPDVAYPNGFADPADPFGNDLSLARRDTDGFPWGMIGLLGLLGLIPLFRRGGRTTRTVYVDRDEPRRVIREEHIEE